MKKVALVGFSTATRHQAPFEDESVEIWGCNEGYVLPFPRIARWFQLHNYQTFSRENNQNDLNHYAWLKSVTDFPIYMQRVYPNIPMSVQYPIDAIVEYFGLPYFSSTFAYMIALAIYEGYEWIGHYGFEMATDSEYFHQRPNAEYLIGWAKGKGIYVQSPVDGNLLRGRMYAYEDESIGFRQQLEFRKALLAGQLKKQEEKFWLLTGQNNILNALAAGRDPILENLAAGGLEITLPYQMKLQQELLDASALANTINGARMEVDLMIQIFDNQNGTKAVDYVTKEIEQNRTSAEGTGSPVIPGENGRDGGSPSDPGLIVGQIRGGEEHGSDEHSPGLATVSAGAERDPQSDARTRRTDQPTPAAHGDHRPRRRPLAERQTEIHGGDPGQV